VLRVSDLGPGDSDAAESALPARPTDLL